MDRYIMNVKHRGFPVAVCVFLLFSKPVVSQEFSWVNEYVGKPRTNWDGSTYYIPVIEDEEELIQCKVSADRDENYKLSLHYDGFNATTTSTFTIGEVGSESAVSNITVKVTNPDDIDNTEILCLQENGDDIGLQFKVFVKDPNIHCCNGTEYDISKSIKLRRPGNQITQNKDILDTLKKKLIKKLKYTNEDVIIDPNGNVCGCKPPGEPGNQNSVGGGGIAAIFFAVAFVVGGGGGVGYKYRHMWLDNFRKKFSRQNGDVDKVEQNEVEQQMVPC